MQENEKLNKMIDELTRKKSIDDPKYDNFFAIKFDDSAQKMKRNQSMNYFDDEVSEINDNRSN